MEKKMVGIKKKKLDARVDLRGIKLDAWQERVMRHQGNMALRCGRQTGKSTVVSIKARTLAYTFPGTTTLVAAASQRQSSLLFEKIRIMMENDDNTAIEKAKIGKTFKNKKEERDFEKDSSIFMDDPTLTRIRLKTGSQIICLPTGKTGAFIRGFTVDFMIIDEAPLVEQAVWVAIEPMMATSKKERGTGWMILLGTPQGKRGYFYEAFQDRAYLRVHIPSKRCPRIGKVFLRNQKKKMTKIAYTQEYEAEFVEEYDQYFPTKVIEEAAKASEYSQSRDYTTTLKYYMGVDVARYGGDENAFYIVEMTRKGHIRGCKLYITRQKSLSDTIGRIEELHKQWNFRKIFIDGAGVGGGVVDVLKDRLGRRIEDIQNAKKSIEVNGEEKHNRLMKEDLYSNLLMLMEQGKFKFFRTAKIVSALRSITFEYREDGALKVKGRGSHTAEAIVRAVWCIKNKGLSLFLA